MATRPVWSDWILRFVEGKYATAEISLERGTSLIGREGTVDVVLLDDAVDLEHARVSIVDDAVSIEDLGSATGTYVNGERVQRALLDPGDRVAIGASTFVLVEDAHDGLEAASTKSAEYQAGCARGEQVAREDVREGRPRRLTIGLLRLGAGMLDPTTGLLRASLGCVLDDDTMGFCDGYNSVVRRALRRGELDAHLLSHKVTSLEDLRARFAREPGHEIAVSALRTRRGLLEVVHEEVNGWDSMSLTYVASGSEQRRLHESVTPSARILLDHDDTTLSIREPDSGDFATFDLETGLCLQRFRAGADDAS